MAPFRAPISAPAPSPAATPTGHGQSRSTTAASSAAIATMEPMERSISPAVSTNTIPTAITVTGAVCCTMFRRLDGVANPSSRRTMEKTTKIARKPT